MPNPAENLHWTWAEYEKLPDDGHQYEIWGGRLVMVPAPEVRHQGTSWDLTKELVLWQERTGDRGKFLCAPTDVELDKDVILQPDLLYIRADRIAQICQKHIFGAPDLVVEIFNRAGAARDRVTKLQWYARYGVPEYWLIDLDERSVLMLGLQNGLYEIFAEGSGSSSLASRVLKGFTLVPEKLFA